MRDTGGGSCPGDIQLAVRIGQARAAGGREEKWKRDWLVKDLGTGIGCGDRNVDAGYEAEVSPGFNILSGRYTRPIHQ